MKTFLSLLFVVVLLGSCASKVQKADVELPLGESMITLPDGAKGIVLLASEKAAPFVIMYHGYASTKDEASKLQSIGIRPGSSLC